MSFNRLEFTRFKWSFKPEEKSQRQRKLTLNALLLAFTLLIINIFNPAEGATLRLVFAPEEFRGYAALNGLGPRSAGYDYSFSEIQCIFELSGQLQEGDGQRIVEEFETLLDTMEIGPRPEIVLCLDSIGGVLSEAFSIAELIVRENIVTKIDYDAECLSACAWIFMAGSVQSMDAHVVPSRVLMPGGILGFHAFQFIADGGYSAEEVEEVFRLGLIALADVIAILQAPLGGVWSYPMDFGLIDPLLVSNAMRHFGNDYYYIDTIGRAGRYDIVVPLIAPPRMESEQLFSRSCDNLMAWYFRGEGSGTNRFSYRDGELEIGLRVGDLYTYNGSLALGCLFVEVDNAQHAAYIGYGVGRGFSIDRFFNSETVLMSQFDADTLLSELRTIP